MTVNLIATISARRAHGLTIARLPYFSWSVLAAGIGIAIATPVFIGGLLLVWIDQHFGGSFFTSSAANALWTHAIWLGGRPEALLPAAFLLGTGSDIIATATGKPNELDVVTRGAIGAFVTFSFLTWTASASDAGAILAPFSNPALVLPALAAGVVILSWLAQLRHGLKAVPALVPLVLALGTAVLGLVDGLIALTNDDRGAIWSQHSLTLFAVFVPLAGAVAALIHWAPKLVGGTVPAPLAGLSSLAVFAGSALYILSGALLGADASADYAPAWSTADGHGGLATLGAVGIIAAAGGIVVLAVGFAAARSKAGAANPYGNGTTLEWAAASPPPPHNFDSVPDVTSATPLVASTAGAAS
jgi:heme/copper-type cytochrome/quinol oxidase subunit 1